MVTPRFSLSNHRNLQTPNSSLGGMEGLPQQYQQVSNNNKIVVLNNSGFGQQPLYNGYQPPPQYMQQVKMSLNSGFSHNLSEGLMSGQSSNFGASSGIDSSLRMRHRINSLDSRGMQQNPGASGNNSVFGQISKPTFGGDN